MCEVERFCMDLSVNYMDHGDLWPLCKNEWMGLKEMDLWTSKPGWEMALLGVTGTDQPQVGDGGVGVSI